LLDEFEGLVEDYGEVSDEKTELEIYNIIKKLKKVR